MVLFLCIPHCPIGLGLNHCQRKLHGVAMDLQIKENTTPICDLMGENPALFTL